MARPEDPSPNRSDHRMQTTRPATLVITVLTAAAISWLGIDNFYGSLPRLPWLPPLTMLGLALVEGVAAVQTRARIERRDGAAPVEPLLVARYVVLAKASALAGAIFAGLYVGLTGWLLVQRGVLAQAALDLPQAIAGSVAALGLVIAGLWLERACQVPPPPPGGDGSVPGGTGRSGDGPTNGGHGG